MKKILCLLGIILCSFMMFSCRDKGFEEVELSDKMKEQIALDYFTSLSEEYGATATESYGGRFACPGKYKNIYFVSLLSSWLFDITIEFRTENDYVRIDYGGYPMFAYMDHSFHSLEDLYKEGKLTEEALLGLNDYTDEHNPNKDGKNWHYSFEDKKLI